MNRKTTKKVLPIIIVFFIISGCILFLPTISALTDYLSRSQKVKANVMVLEGWLPPEAIQLAYNEFVSNNYEFIITTGLNTQEYCLVSMDGYLKFYVRDKFAGLNDSGRHTIEVYAYSELEDENCAHFNLLVNNSVIADFFADKKERFYGTSWEGRLTDIDSIMIQFDNDAMGDFGDRNLYVKKILIDKKLSVPFQYNSQYDIPSPQGKQKIINNYSSLSEIARFELLSLGLDSSKVIAVPGGNTSVNRTLASALAFRDWLRKSEIHVKGINIVSTGSHSRRTFMIYNKILDKSFDIGIISLPENNEFMSRKHKVFKTLRESAGIIYYWFVLILY
jgi:hypothetical protein